MAKPSSRITKTKYSNSQSQSKRFFTPIVASSLTLFLAAGVANAAALDCSTADQPKICYQHNGATTPTDATLSDLTWGNGGNIVIPQTTGGQKLTELKFQFNRDTGGVPTGAASGTTYTITSGLNAPNTQIMILDAGTKSIQMGDNGSGALKVEYGTGVDTKRQFHLNLSKSAGDFSFKGNIIIVGGKGDSTLNEEKNAKFVGAFGKNVIGNIAVTDGGVGNTTGFKAILDFENGANLEGNLDSAAGNIEATFKGGNITGNVSSRGASSVRRGNISVIFKEDGEIQGSVGSKNGGGVSASNTIIFEKNGKIGNGIATQGGSSNTLAFGGTINVINGNITNNAGTNTITATGQTLTIGGSTANKIEASGGGTAKNTITAQDLTINANVFVAIANKNSGNTNTFTTTNLTLEADEIKVSGAENKKVNGNTFTVAETSTITSRLIKATYGKNVFIGKDLVLKADTIDSHGTSKDLAITDNSFTFSGNADITATNITARSGINTFALQDGAMKVGVLSSDGGLNTITLQSGAIAVDTITATGFGRNTLSVADGKITIKPGTNANASNILAAGHDAQATSTNSIVAKTLEVSVASIKAVDGGKNIIEAENGTIAAKNITAGDVTQADGVNSIILHGGNLEAGVVETTSGKNIFELEHGAKMTAGVIGNDSDGENLIILDGSSLGA